MDRPDRVGARSYSARRTNESFLHAEACKNRVSYGLELEHDDKRPLGPVEKGLHARLVYTRPLPPPPTPAPPRPL